MEEKKGEEYRKEETNRVLKRLNNVPKDMLRLVLTYFERSKELLCHRYQMVLQLLVKDELNREVMRRQMREGRIV